MNRCAALVLTLFLSILAQSVVAEGAPPAGYTTEHLRLCPSNGAKLVLEVLTVFKGNKYDVMLEEKLDATVSIRPLKPTSDPKEVKWLQQEGKVSVSAKGLEKGLDYTVKTDSKNFLKILSAESGLESEMMANGSSLKLKPCPTAPAQASLQD